MKLIMESWRQYLNEEGIGRPEQYIKHAALNLGMAARQGKKLIIGDEDAKLKELSDALYYTLVRPWTHHTDEELQGMAKNTVWKWFECGYMESDEQYEEECLNESEIPVWTKKSDFETVYHAMWQFYMDNLELMKHYIERGDWQEVQAKEVAKHGWTWAEYTERGEAEAEAHERRIEADLSIEPLNETVKTIVRIEEEEFVEDDGTVVRKLIMYDDAGEIAGQPTFAYHYLDPRRKKESPTPRLGWLERFLEILDWDLALEDDV